MARGQESTSDLFLRLGLSYDELESGFVDAQRTIRDNMTRLSRENQIIDLQARVEIAGIDEVADAEQILQVRVNALNRELSNQRDRVRLAEAELRNMAQRTGENSDQTQRARLALERERLALTQLEGQLESLTDVQGDTSGGADSLIDRFNGLAETAAPVIAGLTAIVGGMTAAAQATQDLINEFRELQKQAYELNLPVQQTDKLLRQLRLAGGDIGDFEGYIRGITDAYVKGEKDDPEFIALARYGAQVTDATGKLKDFAALTETVYQAWKKAEAAGEGIEFLQMTGGESGVRDAIQFFKRYEEAQADADKIFKVRIDTEELHKADREMNLLTEQMGEFKKAAVSLIEPATIRATSNLFEFFRSGTEAITENKEAIKDWGGAISEALSHALGIAPIKHALFDVDAKDDTAEKIKESAEEAKKAIPTWGDYRKVIDGVKASWGEFRRDTDLKRGENPLNQYGWQRLKEFKDEIEDVRLEIDNFNKDYALSRAQLDLWLKRTLDAPNYLSIKEEMAARELYTQKEIKLEQERADKIKEIREDVEAELGTDLDQKHLDITRKQKDWISAGMEAAEAASLAQKLKDDAIEEELKKSEELIKDAADRQYSLTHDAFEKELYDIERWKDAQLEKAETAEEVAATIANAAMKEAEAFEREMDRIKGKVESGQDRLARLTLSPRDYDLYKAQKDYQADLQTMPQVFADAIYNATLGKIDERAARDKSGDYTKSTGFGASALIYADPQKIAALETLKKYGIGVDELRQALGGTEEAAARYQDLLKKLSSVTGNAADSAGSLSDSTEQGAKQVEAAVNTLQQALELVAGIEEEKARRESQAMEQLRRQSGIEILYGDAENSWRAVENGIEILYGDVDSTLQKLDGYLGDSEKSVADIIREAQEQFDSVPMSDLTNSVTETAGAMDAAASATDNFAEAAINAAERLAQTETPRALPAEPAKPEYPKFEPPEKTPAIDPELMSKALKGTATLGEILAVGGLAAGNPAVALLGAGIQAVADTAQTLQEVTAQQAKQGKPAVEAPELEVAAPKVPEVEVPAPEIPTPESSTPEISFAQVEQNLEEFGGKLRETGEASAALTESLNATASTIDATREKLSQVDFGTAIQPVGEQVEIFRQELESARQSVTAFVESVNLAAERIAQINFQNQSPEWQPPELQQQPESTALAEIRAQVQQSTELQRQIITAIQTASETQAQIISEIQQFSAMTTPQLNEIISAVQIATAQLSQQLAELAGAMADTANAARAAADAASAAKAAIEARSAQGSSQAPSSPTINLSLDIDLGGAYVFDDEMKRQLTDDITTEVADAVTSAVQTATSHADHSYGN